MTLDRKMVEKMASLARLKVDEGALDDLVDELSNIIGWMETLAEVDTDGTSPMTSAVETKLYMRSDDVTDGDIESKVLMNSQDADQGFYTVPKVIE